MDIAGLGVNHPQANFPRRPKKSSDVVEIFHNTTLKSSNSVVSGKCSKLDGQIKKRLGETVNEKIQEVSFPKRADLESRDKEDQNDFQTFNYSNDFK